MNAISKHELLDADEIFCSSSTNPVVPITQVNDKIISDDEAAKIQSTLNNHTAAWMKMVNLGDRWKHSRRYRETALNKTASVPPLSILIKDHKQVAPNSLTKTCSVVSYGQSMN